MGGISERHKEIKRRRKRKEAITKIAKRAEKASATEKSVLAAKLRRMTPGANEIITRLGLGDQ